MSLKKLFTRKKGKKDDDEAERSLPSGSQTSLPREKYGLFNLYSPPTEESEADIVAVHGLNGDWEKTWTESATDKMWLRDFVPVQWKNARVMSFGYDSTVALSQSKADIDDAAINLIDRLDGERRSESTKKRPIIFIAHSLGGIIVKRALIIANERSTHWGHLRDQAKYAIFFAVPHRGADLAFWANLATNALSFASIGSRGNRNLVKALERNSSEFMNISMGFIQPAGNFSIIRTFYETDKIGNQLIVDKDSARLGLTNELAVPVPGANHMDICKFGNSEGQKYKPVWNALEKISESVRASAAPSIQETLPEKDWHRQKLESKCLKALRGSRDYEGHKNRNAKRVDSTCRWVLEDRKFVNWRDHKSAGLLWISAGPGFGKSVFARSLIDEELMSQSEVTTCYFFFKEDDENARQSTDALSVLLYQLLVKHPAFLKYALDYAKDPKLLVQSIHNLWNVLEKIVKDSYSPRLVFIIDALDESLDMGKSIVEKLVEFYSRYQTQDSSPKDVTSKLRFLVTSRPYIDIQRCFGNFARGNDSIQLSGDGKVALLREEIERVIDSELASVKDSLRLPKEVTKLLKDRLLEMENQNYLWLHLVFEIIKQSVGATTITGAQKLIEQLQLPKTVEDAYEAILQKSSDRNEAARLLHIVVAAVRPLLVTEMRIAIAIDEKMRSRQDLDLESTENFIITIRNRCGLFVAINDDKIYLVHKTAKDFLLSATPSPVAGTESNVHTYWKHSIDPLKAHEILSLACIRYLCFSEFQEPQDTSHKSHLARHPVRTTDVENDTELSCSEESYGDETDESCNSIDSMTVHDPRHWGDLVIKRQFRKHRFLEYASSHWLFHTKMVKPSEPMLEQSLRLCDVHSNLCTNWFEVLPARLAWKGPERRDLDFFKSSFKAVPGQVEANFALAASVGVDLAFCTFIGHSRGAERLLQRLKRHFELKPGSQTFVDAVTIVALHFAVEEGREDIVRMLLSKSRTDIINKTLSTNMAGIRQNFGDFGGHEGHEELTALRLAIRSGNLDLVPLLLDMKANPNAFGFISILAEALQNLVSKSKSKEAYRETVELLIRYGAKFQPSDIIGDTRLADSVLFVTMGQVKTPSGMEQFEPKVFLSGAQFELEYLLAGVGGGLS